MRWAGIMARTQDADNQFRPGEKHLAWVISVKWASFPGVGREASGLTVLVKFSVLNRLQAGRLGEPIGREARVYVPVNRDLSATTKEGADFLSTLGVNPYVRSEFDKRTRLDLANRSIACVFGEPDPVHGFQSLIAVERADPHLIDQSRQKANSQARSQDLPFGLQLPRDGVAVRDGKEVPFDSAPIGWFILKRLAEKHPDRYEPRDLARDSWKDARRPPRDDANASLHTEIAKLRKIIKPLNLAIPYARGSSGYLLVDRTD